MSVLPYGRQTIEDDDIASVAEALRDAFLTTGPRVDAKEKAFAQTVGAPHAVACNSGTAALHLAVVAADLGPDDAAVVPSLTFLATANVVRMTGAEVVFADVDAETGLMTPETLSAALRANPGPAKVKLAMPVHLNGQLCDMPDLATAAQDQGAVLVEDACHALGVANVGAARHSQTACFSTHPVKGIATAEGGVVTTRDGQRAERMRRLRSHGMTRDASTFVNTEFAFERDEPNFWYYEMPEIGWNYRLPDVLCALGISQLRKLARFHERRREIASLYDRLLAPLAPHVLPVSNANTEHGWHLYVLRIDFATLGLTRGRFAKAMRERGVGSQVHYIPVHLQPYYRRRYPDVSLPGADAYYARCLSIPFYPAMTNADVHHVAETITSLVRSAS